MIVDIVVPQGKRGGVENLICQMHEYVKGHKEWEIRVIQLVSVGVKWLPDDADYTALNIGMRNENVSYYAGQYGNYLLRRGLPDIILASVWPLMSVVAKLAVEALKPDCPIPVVYWAHAPIYVYEAGGYGRYSQIALSDAQFAISDFIFKELSLHLNNPNILPVKNPAVIPDDKEMVSTKIYNTNAAGTYNLLFVGRISEEKGLETVIDAIRNAPNWTVTIVGSGEDSYADDIKNLIEKNGVSERVTFCGWKANPWECAKEGDYLILPSLFEGFPLTIIEAMSRGIPVISTAVSGTVETVLPGKTGYLFETMNSQQLSEVLLNIESGAFPSINPYDCREIAKRYDGQIAFMDFFAKLTEVLLKFRTSISANFEKTYLYEADKISVFIPVTDADKESIDRCLYSIIHQTLPLKYMEIILVNGTKSEYISDILFRYENEYPENVMIINIDEDMDMMEMYDVALKYSSGNLCFPVFEVCELESDIIDRLYRKIKLYSCDLSFCCESDDTKIDSEGCAQNEKVGCFTEETRLDFDVQSKATLYSRTYFEQNEKNILCEQNGCNYNKDLPVGTKYACIY